MIDWKSLVPAVTKALVTVILTMIATKWADASDTVHKIMNGDTVPLYGGAINLSLSQLQLWVSTGIIAAGTAIWGWYNRTKAKQAANIALQLPRGATKTDVQSVQDASGAFSAQPNGIALHQIVQKLQ